MASTSNAFATLLGKGETVVESKKKSKAKKPKAPTDSASAEATPSIPVAPAPVQDKDYVVGVAEACAIFERAAKESKAVEDKVRLWKDWTRQARDTSAKATRYITADGQINDFRQVLLQSRALEISLENCLTTPLTQSAQTTLTHFIAATLPQGETAASTLSSAIARMSQLISQDGPDTVGAAQRAVHSVVQELKTAREERVGDALGEGASVEARVAAADKEIARRQNMLASLAQKGGVVSKEQTIVAQELVKLHEKKLELLSVDGSSSTGSSVCSESTRKHLADLKATITKHIKAAQSSGKGAAEAARSQTLSAYKHEEALLTQRAAELATQIRTLEAQLSALRSESLEVDEKRKGVRLQQQALSRGGPTNGFTGGLDAAHFNDELEVAEALECLVDPSKKQNRGASSADLAASQAGTSSAMVESTRSFLEMSLSYVADMPNKIRFCQQRIAQAEKLIKLGAGTKIAEENVGQRAASQDRLEETLKSGSEVVAQCRTATSRLHSHLPSLLALSPESAQELHDGVAACDALLADITAQQEAALQAAHAPLPAAPAAQPAPRGGPRKGANTNTGANASTPAPAAAISVTDAPASGSPVTKAAATAAVPAATAATPTPAAATASKPAAAAAAPAAAPKPVPARPPSSTKQWAKPAAETAESAPGDDQPTPAEAFKAPQSVDGFTEIGGKKNRRQKA